MSFQHHFRKVFVRIFFPIFILFLILNLYSTFANAQNSPLAQRGEQEAFGNLKVVSQFGHLVLSDQPDKATFRMIKDQGITMVINIRGEVENEGFDERKLAAEEGVAYIQVPYMDGRYIQKDAVNELLSLIASTSNNGTKVMIHCSHSQRTGSLLGIALVEAGYSRENANVIAREAGMTSTFLTKIHNEYLDSLSQ